MTLVLTAISRHAVVQASDRLVSRAGRPADPLANKTVVYGARDALVAISYSGLAALEGLRTDDWIARQLRCVDEWVAGDRAAGPGLSFRRGRWLDIGQAVERLRSELERVFADAERPHRRYAHVLALAGWQWSLESGRARPIAWAIDKPAGTGDVSARSLIPRHWYESRFLLLAIPLWPDEFSQDAREALFDALRPNLGDPIACERVLVDGIRAVSEQLPGQVGSHALAVSLPAPTGVAEGHVCFRPWAPGPGAPTRPVAYMPWFVLGDRLVAPASVIQGTFGPVVYEGGGARVAAEGVEAELP